MRKSLIAVAAGCFCAALTAAAIAAPISLEPTHVSFIWHGRSIMNAEGPRSFVVRASSTEKLGIENQNCRPEGQSTKASIAYLSSGMRSETIAKNGHVEHILTFPVQFGEGAGTCTFVLQSGNDRATLTLHNSGRPAA